MSSPLTTDHPQLAAFLAAFVTHEVGTWSDQPPTYAELTEILTEGLDVYDESWRAAAA